MPSKLAHPAGRTYIAFEKGMPPIFPLTVNKARLLLKTR
jgi:hypothetical protein